jgi:hypothetical protein
MPTRQKIFSYLVIVALAVFSVTLAYGAEGDVIKTWNLAPDVTSLRGVGFDGQFIYLENAGTIRKYGLSGNLVQTFSYGYSPIGFAWDGQYMWTTNPGANGPIHKINISNWTIVESISFSPPSPPSWLCTVPHGIAWDGSKLWIVTSDSCGMYTMDPSTKQITWKFKPPGTKSAGLAWDGQYFWISDYVSDGGDITTLDDHVYKINPNTGSVLSQFTPPSGKSRGMTYDSVDGCLLYTGITPTLYFISTGATTPCSIPGTPSSPSPSNGATGVSINPTLIWSASSNTDSYDVYFGTASSPQYVGNTTGTSYSRSGLSYSTTYYWKIVAKNNCGNSTSGSVWSFTTAAYGAEGDVIKTWNLAPDVTSLRGVGFDGQFIYLENAGTIRKYGLSGNLVQTFSYGYSPIGFAWDGQYMWTTHPGENGPIHKKWLWGQTFKIRLTIISNYVEYGHGETTKSRV